MRFGAVRGICGRNPRGTESANPPAYPRACMPAGGEAMPAQRVTVVYDVSARGLPENVRVRETTNECFNDVAVAAIRRWVFEPRKVDRRSRPQEDLESTFTFVLAGETVVDVFDARPKKRVPPRFPGKCERRAAREERVTVRFDVTEKGETDNIIVAETTNSCFDRAAIDSVKRWEYHPRFLDGKPVARLGVETRIVFQLGDGKLDQENRMRKTLVRKMNKAGRLIETDPEAALAALAEIEAEYGDSFTSAETAGFHQIRGFARIAANDPQGALDDLYIASSRFSASQENHIAISEAIRKLELYLAAVSVPQESAEAPDESGAVDETSDTEQ